MSYRNDVEVLRQENCRLREEIEWVQNAPLPMLEAQAWIDEQLKTAVKESPLLRIAGIAASAEKQCGLSYLLNTTVRGSELGGRTAYTSEILVALFSKQISATLFEALKELDYEAGLPMAERPARLRELRARLFDLECQEEALIEAAWSENVEILRREDADPVAVLGYDQRGNASTSAALFVPLAEAIKRAQESTVPSDSTGEDFRSTEELFVPQTCSSALADISNPYAGADDADEIFE